MIDSVGHFCEFDEACPVVSQQARRCSIDGIEIGTAAFTRFTTFYQEVDPERSIDAICIFEGAMRHDQVHLRVDRWLMRRP